VRNIETLSTMLQTEGFCYRYFVEERSDKFKEKSGANQTLRYNVANVLYQFTDCPVN